MDTIERRAREMAAQAAASRAAARQALEAYQEVLHTGGDPTHPYEMMNALYDKAQENEDTATTQILSFSEEYIDCSF